MMTSDGIAIEFDPDRDGVIVTIPDLSYQYLDMYALYVDIGLEWRHLRELRDAIIKFLGDNQ